MQKLITLVMIMFMTLGPVASLSAQVNSVKWINSNASLGIIVEESFEERVEKSTEENIQQLAQNDTKHNCCEESKCNCTYQNECDIQNLTFFALSKPQLHILASIESSSILTTYLPFFYKSESSSIYRPPIA